MTKKLYFFKKSQIFRILFFARVPLGNFKIKLYFLIILKNPNSTVRQKNDNFLCFYVLKTARPNHQHICFKLRIEAHEASPLFFGK